ncbi:sulfatase-like hydrolase/transferase [Adhaeretor mobilis]|uniref:Choline-sulfatase n=1 Tax=Adhaeretor mobilis TaxID=1930276 RepID=A0A517MVB4_9BACT|nr:sulfatase-like hydrolase/transferase [Adhaeretor mobilis]QDS98820.1 Choline-sulfatase [Adhaeretor mobilis]
MKKQIELLICLSLINFVTLAVKAHGAEPLKTNVVLILADDLGWKDLGCYGSDYYQTPNIDRVASEGMRFTDGYSACNVCSPTRAAIMSGKYPARLLLTQWLPGGRWSATKNELREGRYISNLPLEEVTIAEAMREAGYRTAFMGKWHLGAETYYYPEHQGFDINIGGRDYGAPGSYFYPFEGTWKIPTTGKTLFKDSPLPGKEGDYLVDRLAEEAEKFIRQSADKPFFLMLSHYAVHTPLEGKPDKVARYEKTPKKQRQGKAAYAAMVESVDDSVGRVMRTLKELDLDERTLVIFASDNGGFAKVTDNAPLRANKGSNYDGGIRVPVIVKWPGKTTPGSVSHEPVISTDFYPTILAATGQPLRPHQHMDGKNLTPVLTGEGKLDREALYWHYPHYNQHPSNFPSSVVRAGDWKLIEDLETGKAQLYNLAEDIGETHDLSTEQPEKVKRLQGNLNNWRKDVGADPMTPNPQYQKTTSTNVNKRSAKPNVLFLAVDDMNDWISVFDPDAPIKTPHIESLAQRGTLFTKAYCASPACNPSRTATLTGQRPSTSGVYGNKTDWRKALPTRKTIMQQFMAAGYDVLGAGKIFHHHYNGAFHDAASFHDFQQMRPQKYPKEKLNHAPEYGSQNTDWGEWPNRVEDSIDFKTANYCIEALNEPVGEKPLFLACGIFKPHSPFFAPSEYHQLYRNIDLPLRKEDDWKDLPEGADSLMKKTRWFWGGMMQAEQQNEGSYHDFIRSYAACAAFADAQVGCVLEALAKSTRRDNTIIVLWSDHGFHLGEKDHIEKFALWEKTNHIPLIVVAPGVTTPGSRCERPVDLTALYPTLLELSGLPADELCDGKSIVPLLRDPTRKWDQPALMTYLRGNHAVRSNRWRYIRYADGSEELYDHKVDPNEWDNVAGDERFKEVIARLQEWLPKQEAKQAPDMPKPKSKRDAA